MSKATIVANPPTLRSFAWSNSSPPSKKASPFTDAIARNKYLKAIRDGFISVIPIIIFSSIFCLVASVPNIWFVLGR